MGNHFALIPIAIAVPLIAADTDLRSDSPDLVIETPITLRFADEEFATVTDGHSSDNRVNTFYDLGIRMVLDGE